MGRVEMAGILLACVLGCGGRTAADLGARDAGSPTVDAASVDEPDVDGGRTPAGSDGGVSPMASTVGVIAHAPVDGLPACGWPANLVDAGPGLRGCNVGRVMLDCVYPSGGYCLCESSELTACDPDPNGCSAGGTCRSVCGPNQYGVDCGGVPGFAYQDPPAGCVWAGFDQEEGRSVCCPCQ